MKMGLPSGQEGDGKSESILWSWFMHCGQVFVLSPRDQAQELLMVTTSKETEHNDFDTVSNE